MGFGLWFLSSPPVSRPCGKNDCPATGRIKSGATDSVSSNDQVHPCFFVGHWLAAYMPLSGASHICHIPGIVEGTVLLQDLACPDSSWDSINFNICIVAGPKPSWLVGCAATVLSANQIYSYLKWAKSYGPKPFAVPLAADTIIVLPDSDDARYVTFLNLSALISLTTAYHHAWYSRWACLHCVFFELHLLFILNVGFGPHSNTHSLNASCDNHWLDMCWKNELAMYLSCYTVVKVCYLSRLCLSELPRILWYEEASSASLLCYEEASW